MTTPPALAPTKNSNAPTPTLPVPASPRPAGGRHGARVGEWHLARSLPHIYRPGHADAVRLSRRAAVQRRLLCYLLLRKGACVRVGGWGVGVGYWYRPMYGLVSGWGCGPPSLVRRRHRWRTAGLASFCWFHGSPNIVVDEVSYATTPTRLGCHVPRLSSSVQCEARYGSHHQVLCPGSDFGSSALAGFYAHAVGVFERPRATLAVVGVGRRYRCGCSCAVSLSLSLPLLSWWVLLLSWLADARGNSDCWSIVCHHRFDVAGYPPFDVGVGVWNCLLFAFVSPAAFSCPSAALCGRSQRPMKFS